MAPPMADNRVPEESNYFCLFVSHSWHYLSLSVSRHLAWASKDSKSKTKRGEKGKGRGDKGYNFQTPPPTSVLFHWERECSIRHRCVEREVLTTEYLGSQPDRSWGPQDLPGAFQVFSHKEQILILTKGLVSQWEITGQWISSSRREKKKNSSDQLPSYQTATFP